MKGKDIRQFILITAGLILLSLIVSKYFFRIDLTTEKRYTLSSETKQILRQLNEPIYFDVFLDGDMPAGFRKLRTGIREMLDDFKSYSGRRLTYRFIDPSEASSPKQREAIYAKLDSAGVRPISVNKQNKDGSLSQQIVFPGALVRYKGVQLNVNLLRNIPGQSADVNLNSSIEALEYELIRAVQSLSNDSIEKIAFIEGHGELSEVETADLTVEFSNYYQVDRGIINGQLNILDPYKAIIIAKPQHAFDEKDKFIIDRYIMRGGKVMWLIDAVNVNTDSLFSSGSTLALAGELNLEDQLFTYGARINATVVQDIVANKIPVTTGNSQMAFAPWLYYPLINPSPNHPVTRNLNPVWLRYASDIDTVGLDPGVRKTVLLHTSPMSRTRAVPFMISLQEVERMPEQSQFNKPDRTTALLLEGRFTSVFRSRMAQSMFPNLTEPQAEHSVDTKMLVVADGDIARNEVRVTPQGTMPAYPLGYDRYTRQTFGNKEFLINALNYLTDDKGLMQLRDREFQLRLLNKTKVSNELLKWQLINVGLPVILLLIVGFAYGRWRRYKFS